MKQKDKLNVFGKNMACTNPLKINNWFPLPNKGPIIKT